MEGNQVLEQLKTVHEEFKRYNDAADAERKKYGEELGETKEVLSRVQDKLDAVEKMAARLGRPADVPPTEGPDVEKSAFLHYVCKGDQKLTPDETKALASNSDPDGGYLVPSTMRAGIISYLRERSPVREIAAVQTLTQGHQLEVVREANLDMSTGWVGETAARTETTSPTLSKLVIPAHEMYAMPYATQTALDDAVGVESWLVSRIGERFAQVENAAFLTGDGVGKPLGLLDAANAISTVNSGHATLLTADGLINLVYALPEFYSRNARILAARATIRDVRKLKDGMQQYLWQPGLTALQPASILGVPYSETVDMPAIGAGLYPIVIGDFSMYQIVDRQGIRLVRDPYSAKPYVQFYTTRRVGGQCLRPEAFRIQIVSA